METTSFSTNHVSRNLGAAKSIFPTIFLYDFAEEDTAVIILFSTELFRVKHRRDSENNFFAASSLKSRPQYAYSVRPSVRPV